MMYFTFSKYTTINYFMKSLPKWLCKCRLQGWIPSGGSRRGAGGTAPSRIDQNLAKLAPFVPILASTPPPPNSPPWIRP